MRYITPLSFSKYNPDWTIKIYSPKQPGQEPTWINTTENKNILTTKCYFDKLKNIPNVEMIEIDFDDNISDVFRSDILRLDLLSTEGGLWSDFDIFYFKPICSLALPDAETYMCYNTANPRKSEWYHSIGFMMSCPNNAVFKELRNKVEEFYDPTNYQCIGSHMYNAVVDPSKFYNLPFKTVYPVQWNCIKQFYTQNVMFDSASVGIHWYAGSEISAAMEEFITKETIECYSYPSSGFSFILKEILCIQ